jgi:hypothetical protein
MPSIPSSLTRPVVRRVLALGACLAAGLGGLALAQPAPSGGSSVAEPPMQLTFQPSPEEEDLSKYSCRELVDRGQKLVNDMDKQLTDSFYMLEASVAAGDIAAANARNEAITVMKGLVKLAETNLRSLKQRCAENDRPRAENEFIKVAIASGKVREYYAQVRSSSSVGMEAFEVEGEAVTRQLSFSGTLPVLSGLSTQFSAESYAPFQTDPSPPANASPWF